MGYQFNVIAPVQLVGLALYDDFGNGLTGSHAVGLWDPSGTLIASTSVDSSDPLIGTGPFRWHAVDPLFLAVGNDYRVAGVTSTDSWAGLPATLSVNPSIQAVYDRWTPLGSGSTLTYPTYTDGFVGLWGGNIVLESESPVPEPSSGLLLVGASVFCLFLRPRLKC